MTLTELNNYFNSFLKKEDYAADISLNGIQIQNKEPKSKQITKVAFAVDACETTEKKEARQSKTKHFLPTLQKKETKTVYREKDA